MQSFLQCDERVELETALNNRWEQQHAAHETAGAANGNRAMHVGQVKNTAHLLRKLSLAGNRCRERRHELSLLLIEPYFDEGRPLPHVQEGSPARPTGNSPGVRNAWIRTT